jgi:hypothetical protein
VILGAGASLDPIQLLLINAGTAGVVVVLILVGWLWAKPSVVREFEKADAQHAQDKALLDTLLADYRTSVLPTLMDVDKRVIPLLESTSLLLQRVEGLLDRIEREWERRDDREGPEARRTSRPYQDRRRGGAGEESGSGDYPPGEDRPR